MDDVFVGKMATIERCLARVREEYAGSADNLANVTRQDAVVLNLQRACEAAIDLAMHIVSTRRLGVPKATREAFQLLADTQLLSADTCERMKRMVGFRNVAVHDYQALSLAIVQHIVEDRLDDFRLFVREPQATAFAKSGTARWFGAAPRCAQTVNICSRLNRAPTPDSTCDDLVFSRPHVCDGLKKQRRLHPTDFAV